MREREARFGRLTEPGLIGIVFADTSGAIHDANKAFLDIVGTRSRIWRWRSTAGA